MMGLLPAVSDQNQIRLLASGLLILIVFTRPDCSLLQGMMGVLAGVALPTTAISQAINKSS